MRPIVPLAAGALVVAGATLLAPHPLSAHARAFAENLPLIGGSGGNAFTRDCPKGSVLTGVRWRTGLALDGLGIACSPVLSNGSLGAEVDVGAMTGGNGGTAGRGHCQGGVVAAQGGSSAGVSLDGLFLRCFTWYAASRSYGGTYVTEIEVKKPAAIPFWNFTQCRDGTAPATGIYGRHGSLVDAVALKCGTP